MFDAVARLAEVRVRSIVVGLPVDGSILVLRLCGVMRHIELLLSRSSEMDLPDLLVRSSCGMSSAFPHADVTIEFATYLGRVSSTEKGFDICHFEVTLGDVGRDNVDLGVSRDFNICTDGFYRSYCSYKYAKSQKSCTAYSKKSLQPN
jgi:hypothetical protein